MLEELNGASTFTMVVVVILTLFMIGNKVRKSYYKFARRCGVQKFLLIGYIQKYDKLDPGEAQLKANKLTLEIMRDNMTLDS